METVKGIGHLFSTADAEGITFRFDGSDLHLSFTDWRGVAHEVAFPDAICVSWGGSVDGRFRYDSPHEVLNSDRIRTLPDAGAGHRHYVLCFNGASNLEVVSQQIKVQKMEN